MTTIIYQTSFKYFDEKCSVMIQITVIFNHVIYQFCNTFNMYFKNLQNCEVYISLASLLCLLKSYVSTWCKLRPRTIHAVAWYFFLYSVNENMSFKHKQNILKTVHIVQTLYFHWYVCSLEYLFHIPSNRNVVFLLISFCHVDCNESIVKSITRTSDVEK